MNVANRHASTWRTAAAAGAPVIAALAAEERSDPRALPRKLPSVR